MRIPGLKLARSTLRWSRAVYQCHALVLGYHRVAQVPWDPRNMCVSPENFIEQLEVLRSIARPISLKRLVSSLGQEAPPPRSVVLTFDDGYLDSLMVAGGALRELKIPATIFVSTGWMGREFWWDKLTRLAESRDKLDRPFAVSLGGQYLTWQPNSQDSGSRKNAFIRSASDFMRRLAPDEQGAGIRAIFDGLETTDAEDREVRCMNASEVASLAGDELIEVGSHTVTHPMLSRMAPAAQHHELTESKAVLEALLGHSVTSFCYPHGAYGAETPRIAKEVGYDCACATFSGPILQASDPHLLPRAWVPDLPGESFRRWLKRRLW